MGEETMLDKVKSILLNHWTVIISMVLGGLFGVFCPQIAKNLSFLGNIYIDLLQIAIVPIMMVALICSFCHIFKSNESLYYIKRLFFWFILFTLITLGVTFGITSLIKPGAHLSETALQLLNNSIASSEDSLKGLPTIAPFTGIISYIEDIIPVNIIKSIYDRNDIAIVIFSIVLGVSLGITKNPHVPTAVSFFDAMFSAFLRYVNGLIYALPLALFFLISNFVSQVGLPTLTSLFDLILSVYASVIFIFLMFSLIISRKTKTPFFKCFKYLKNPYLISFGTSSSFAAMPAAMLALRDNFKIDKQNIELVLPLGISLFKPGIMIRSIATTIFLMHLYHISFNTNSILILMLTTVVCSLASTAGPAILSATMYGMVLSPLGIPPAIGIFLLLSIEPIIDPVSTMLNVQSNCTVTILVGK